MDRKYITSWISKIGEGVGGLNKFLGGPWLAGGVACVWDDVQSKLRP